MADQPDRADEICRDDEFAWRPELDQVKQVLRRRSASGAIAGPRGVGKTELMKAALREGSPRRSIHFMVSSATKYDEHQFIMSLFDRLAGEVNRRLEYPLARVAERFRLPASARNAVILGWVVVATWIILHGTGYSWAVAIDRSYPFVPIAVGAFIVYPTIFWILGVAERVMFSISQTPHGRLRRSTESRLERLAFDQTYTMSMSTEATVSTALKLGAVYGRQLARHPYTLVSLIQDYRDYAHDVAGYFGKIHIGIDELDKLATGDEVREFLRGIKGIFGIENVCYIVSISDEAAHQFDLTNLGARDEMDSSFSEVIRVRPLSVAGCIELLQKRDLAGDDQNVSKVLVILSGGSPRDLLRIARSWRSYVGEVGLSSDDASSIGSASVLPGFIRRVASDERTATSNTIRQSTALSDALKHEIVSGLTGPELTMLMVNQIEGKITDHLGGLSRYGSARNESAFIGGLPHALRRLAVRGAVCEFLAANLASLDVSFGSTQLQELMLLSRQSPYEAYEALLKLSPPNV